MTINKAKRQAQAFFRAMQKTRSMRANLILEGIMFPRIGTIVEKILLLAPAGHSFADGTQSMPFLPDEVG